MSAYEQRHDGLDLQPAALRPARKPAPVRPAINLGLEERLCAGMRGMLAPPGLCRVLRFGRTSLAEPGHQARRAEIGSGLKALCEKGGEHVTGMDEEARGTLWVFGAHVGPSRSLVVAG